MSRTNRHHVFFIKSPQGIVYRNLRLGVHLRFRNVASSCVVTDAISRRNLPQFLLSEIPIQNRAATFLAISFLAVGTHSLLKTVSVEHN